MASPKVAPNPLGVMVDELGDLEKELAPLQAKIARVEMLRKTLRGSADAIDAALSHQVDGARFVLALGPRALESEISIPKLVKAIGTKLFLKFAKCTLKDLTVHAPEVVGEVITKTQTGSRSFKIFEKGVAG